MYSFMQERLRSYHSEKIDLAMLRFTEDPDPFLLQKDEGERGEYEDDHRYLLQIPKKDGSEATDLSREIALEKQM